MSWKPNNGHVIVVAAQLLILITIAGTGWWFVRRREKSVRLKRSFYGNSTSWISSAWRDGQERSRQNSRKWRKKKIPMDSPGREVSAPTTISTFAPNAQAPRQDTRGFFIFLKTVYNS